MRKRTLTAATSGVAFSIAALGWLGCTQILGDFSNGPGGDAGADAVTTDGALSDQSTADVIDASNCTVTGTCAPGYPCSSATQCASGVCGTDGTCSAPQCAADASCALGTTCENGGSCASGDCVDGVCCATSVCPACMNCGSTGQCNQAVVGMDDLSPTSCSGNSTCNASGACVERWSTLGSSPTVGYFDSAYAAALGNSLYFGYTSTFESFDVTTNAFTTQPHDAGMCWCGSPGPVTAGATQLFILYDGTFDAWTPGNSAWSTFISQEPGYTGGSAFAAYGGKVYAMGGSYSSTTSSAWSATPTANGVWTSIASMPSANAGACAGVDAANGKIYVFGGDSGSSTSMAAYTVATNTWATVPAVGTPSCNYTTVPTWEGNMVYADYGGVHVFDFATQAWGTTLPLPTGVSLQSETALVPSDGHLYLVAYDGTNDNVYKWNLN